MSVVRYCWRLKSLGGASAGTPRACYWLCDTEAEQPTTGINEGDLCFTMDSHKLWRRTNAAWVEVGGGTGSVDWADITNKPATFPPDTHNHDAAIASAIATHEAASDPHTSYQRESEKGAANGYAGLDAGTKVPVAQLPTGSSASTVCIGNDARLSDSRAPNGSATGDLGGSYPGPTVTQARGLRESGGTTLTMGAVADGEYLRRSGTSIVGGTPAGGGGSGQLVVNLLADGAAVAYTNMAAAASFFAGSHRYATKLDLSGYTQVRLIVNKQATAGAANAKVRLRYITAFSTTVGSWLAIGASEVQVAVNVQNTVLDSGWINLVAGAKADVFVTLDGIGGDGALDPVFGAISAQFR